MVHEQPDTVTTTDVVPAPPVRTRETHTLSVAPQDVTAGDLVRRLDMIEETMKTAMRDGIDYGVIPGAGDKPTLLKPGAEKLSTLFQLDIQLDNVKTWGPGDHLTVESHATAFHQPTGARLGSGEGVCSTREKKYSKRRTERVCPVCGKAAVIKGQEKYGGGWVCWKKRDGCGAKFNDGDQQIESQEVGESENPDLADLWNTVTKMAEKRARVDVVLAVTSASAVFTQDIEDGSPDDLSPRGDTAAVVPASADQLAATERALCFILDESDPDDFVVTQTWAKLQGDAGAGKPIAQFVAVAVVRVAQALRGLRESRPRPGDSQRAAKAVENAMVPPGQKV